jgi:addiction module HigA family antidote
MKRKKISICDDRARTRAQARVTVSPTSPGEILYEEFLKPLGITQRELAEHIHCDYKVINRIVNERASVTPEIAIKLAGAFNMSPEFWLNAQRAIDLWKLRAKWQRIRPLMQIRRKSTV